MGGDLTVDLGLEGRGALIGGATRGLGRAVAEELASEGCRVVLWSRDPAALKDAAEAISDRTGRDVFTVAADARDPASPETVAGMATAALGRVDILVINAGGPDPVDPTRTNPNGWREAFQLLAVTPIELATRLLPPMREAGWGRIVALLSSTIRQPISNLVYSTGCRSALEGWMKTAATAVAQDGVTINGVLPGRFDTDRVKELDRERAEREGRSLREVRAANEATIPVSRYGRPQELASLVAYLSSDRATYQTGTFVAVDGGLIQGL